jgi:hypothetical protein
VRRARASPLLLRGTLTCGVSEYDQEVSTNYETADPPD